jgi:hypothetical protein
MLDAAADFVYVRLHGDVRIYTSGYSDWALASWARRIRRWARGDRDVYVYFDNDVKVRAPFDALALMRRLGCAWQPWDSRGSRGPVAPRPRRTDPAHLGCVRTSGYRRRRVGCLATGGSRQLTRGASLTVSGTSRAIRRSRRAMSIHVV